MATTLAHAEGVVPLWAPKGVADDPDSFVGFRATVQTRTKTLAVSIVGASEYLVWLDGKLVHDGPARYARAFPEYQTFTTAVSVGTHVLAVQVRHVGATTRILSDIPPYLWCRATDAGKELKLNWKCARLPGHRAKAGRISDILGWTDWIDTRQAWPDWQQASFNDSNWSSPIPVDPGIGPIKECRTKPVRIQPIPTYAISKGQLATTFGYEADEPAARFFLDDLSPKSVPPQGIWRRYDLGRVRLGRPCITLDSPAGTVVEYALSEQLQHGRVTPWLTLSGSRTLNFDHFVARGGVQTFMPFTPKGGRYLEIHVKSPGPVRFVKEEFLERTSFSDPIGTFSCGDPLLERIWRTGVNTVRACADDALVDCPTRERGEWTGDVASVATDIAAVAFGDLSLSRRALVQAAQSAREDGMVAGVGPGDPGYLSTYAAQWATACVHYWELTGDKSLLTELYPAAHKNMAAFASHWHDTGLDNGLGWGFVDWGYVGNEGPSDMALNLHYLEALRAMARWSDAVGDTVQAGVSRVQAKRVQGIVESWMKGRLARPGGWANVGYHQAVLALHAGIVPRDQTKDCVRMIKRHLMSCFPNNPSGPRLSDPGVQDPQVMTPYFGHWAMAALMEQGEADFVLSQYKKCWGWALQFGDTTWLEVFDTRWSHCHEWSGCPTWQLSRYVLGIKARQDLGVNVYDFDPVVCRLQSAAGMVPVRGGTLRIDWRRTRQGLRVSFAADVPTTVRVQGKAYLLRDSRRRSLSLGK
ncbi:MAG: hypothetical protein JSS65_05475 [Armatimonadetes bacterium]|nr:hypothetical protein [Armatimonadota bacterium]